MYLLVEFYALNTLCNFNPAILAIRLGDVVAPLNQPQSNWGSFSVIQFGFKCQTNAKSSEYTAIFTNPQVSIYTQCSKIKKCPKISEDALTAQKLLENITNSAIFVHIKMSKMVCCKFTKSINESLIK